MKIASLDIDAQKCFTPLCPNELPVPLGHLIASELNQQAQLANLRIGTKDAHSPHALWIATEEMPQFTPIASEHIDIRWKKHAVPGEPGFQLLDELPHPADYDFFVWKGVEPDMHPYGACYHDLKEKLSTGLIEYLTVQCVTHLIVGGLALDYCVKTTVLQLLKAGFKVTVNQAACAGMSIKTTQAAIAEMTHHGATLVSNARDIRVLSTDPNIP